MLSYDLDEKNKYYSLYEHIRDDILSGKLKSGFRLPSKRAMAENASVSVITVQNAYDQLLAEGYIYSKERSGYFVEEVNADFYGKRELPEIVREKKAEYKIDFVKGNTLTELFPFSVWSRLMRSVLSDCGEHLLQRVPCDGDAELKRAVASYLYRARAIDVDPRYIVIGAGAEYLYGIIVQLLGRDKLYAVENPGYGKIRSTYILNGAEVVGVGVTDAGINCGEVEKSGATVVHFSPSHQFPTGAVAPVSERLRLIKWARENDGYIVEDDYDSEFRLVGKPLQCAYNLCPDRVIYMNTFSKSLAPSMRMGYMVLPHGLYERYLKLFESSACAVPLFEQKTLAKMLDGGFFERHISRLKNRYKAVRQAVYEKVKLLPYPTEVLDTGSGLHLLIRFPTAKNDEEVKERAKKIGINLKCVSDYLLSPAPVLDKCAIINYSGVTEKQISSIEIN
ncbi:MAG: PLP-dependent aminotransferase family protein [Clostridia bacterium]|nr:PLP-dependent aminotransferase family protein [Clostridia bacterium]